jgi:uncharacterized membrane protein YkoI
MKTLTRKILASIAVALTLGLAATGTAQAQACLDKRQIQEAVSSGQIRSLDAVLVAAGVGSNVEILSVQVCDEGGRLVYIVGTLSPDGTAQNLVLDAQ